MGSRVSPCKHEEMWEVHSRVCVFCNRTRHEINLEQHITELQDAIKSLTSLKLYSRRKLETDNEDLIKRIIALETHLRKLSDPFVLKYREGL